MIKAIGLVLMFFGVVLLLGGVSSPSTDNSFNLTFILGLLLAIVGVLVFIYDPVEDAKNHLLHAVNTQLKTLPREEVEMKVRDAEKMVRETHEKVEKDIQSAAENAKGETKRKINQMAKEVQRLTE